MTGLIFHIEKKTVFKIMLFLNNIQPVDIKNTFTFLVAYGPLWKHYTDIWPRRNDPNILILFYEDLHKVIFLTYI